MKVSGRNGWDDARMAIDVKIEQLWIPDSLDTPDAADFLAAVEVGRKVRMQTGAVTILRTVPRKSCLSSRTRMSAS